MNDALARVLMFLGLVVCIFGCKDQMQEGNSVDEECGPPIRGTEPLLQKGVTLLLGELHGTEEIPQAVGDLACRAARAGHPVRVGLEMSQKYQASIDRFLESKGTEADLAMLLSEDLWHPEWPDGRTSAAAVKLLERMRRLRQQGLDVKVFMLQQPSYHQLPADWDMADTIQQVRAARPDAFIVVEAGNNHMRIDLEDRAGGMLLRWGHPIFSLDIQHSRGTYWGCPVPCGVRQAFGAEDLGTERFAELGDIYDRGSSQPAFHGILYVGSITASLPPAGSPSEH